MRYLIQCLLLITSALVAGCHRPEPNPELKDGVYLELAHQAEEAKKKIPELEKACDEAKADLDSATPQTGKKEYAYKHFVEAQERLERAKQAATYLEIRADSRLKYDNKTYLESFKNNKPWTAPDEFKDFEESEKARATSSHWDHDGRLKAAGVTPTIKPVAKEAAKEKKKESEAE